MSELPNHLKEDIDAAKFEIEKAPSDIRALDAAITMTMMPRAIPIETIRGIPIAQAFFDEFGARFDASSVSLPEGSQADNISPDHLIQFQLSNGKPVLFRGGFAEFGEEGLFSVSHIAFGVETISAAVSGTTRQAEYICKRVIESSWRASGRERKWGEISEDLQFVSHQTTTIVDLKFDQMDFYSVAFNRFVKDNFESSKSFGQHIGFLGQRNAEARMDLVVKSVFKRVVIDLSIFDTVSGDQEDSAIEIVPSTRDQRNRSVVKIASELPFDKHVEMVEALLSTMRDSE